MPSLMVCALLGLAVAVLLDVVRAPGPAARMVETPALIVGLERLRAGAPPPRPSRRPRATPGFIVDEPEQNEVSGEIETAAQPPREVATLPSVIVEL